MQLQFRRQISHGLSALLSYTWSHSIDDVSNDEAAVNAFDPRLDRGSSDFDVHHAFNGAFTYNFPTPNWRAPLRAILKDWSLGTIFSARTALPVDVRVERADVISDVATGPDLVPGVPVYLRNPTAPGGKRINPAAFSIPAEPIQGNMVRNSLRAFSIMQADLNIRRQFSITENLKLQWQADFFNLLNHPNFGMINGNLGLWDPPLEPNPGFGLAGSTAAAAHGLIPLYSAGGPRSIQLSLRLRF